jgi:hypothetical protein
MGNKMPFAACRRALPAWAQAEDEEAAAAEADFRKCDADKGGTMSLGEMRQFVVEHNRGQKNMTVQLNLSIDREESIDIATHVAFTLAGGKGDAEITLEQATRRETSH